MQKHITKFLILTIILTAALSVNYLFAAWTGPTQAPPGGNTSTPVHVGSTNQVKDGGLSLDALSVFGGGYFQGDVGVGVVTPKQKLDIEGGIEVGNTTTETAGTIRWTGVDLEVYDGSAWVSLTSEEAAPAVPAVDPNYTDCINAGADWVESDGACYFPNTSCPSGWTPKENYSSSSGNFCDGRSGQCTHGTYREDGTACSTGSHYRGNTTIETCGYAIQKAERRSTRGQGKRYYCWPWPHWRTGATCTATQTEIGCTKN